MRKKLFLLLLTIVCCVCLAFGISACSGNNNNTSTDTGSSNANNSTEDSSGGGESSGEAHEHNLQAVAAAEAACTEDGNTAYWYCNECGKYYSDAEATEEITLASTVIPALGHSYDTENITWTWTEDTTNGDYTATATFTCKNDSSHTEEVTATVTSETISATCTSNGETVYTATVTLDGSTYTDATSVTIPATGHSLTHIEAVAATCDTAGNTEYWYCSTCEKCYSNEDATTEISLIDTVISATGHSYNSSGNCTVCGAEIVGSEGLEYTLSSKGSYYTVSGIGNCEATDIVIPLKYNNISVTAIAASAFSEQTQITSVYILNSVTSIGSNAFYGCTSLTSITIGSGVTTIGNYAFYNCTALTEINFNATTMSDLSANNYVFYRAGKNDNGITLTIGANVTQVPAYLFYPWSSSSDAPKLTSVVFEEGSVCKIIGNNAFFICTSLTSIDIPDSVTSIGSYAFHNCTSLKSVTIGGSVTSIGNSSFYNCSSLTSVTIPDSVTSIGSSSFYSCSSLTSVTIPSSVISIGNSSFSGCGSLTSVYYSGTASKWASISFGNGSSNPLYYAGNLYLNGTLAEEITLEGITSINAYAFYNCTSLTSVTIPDSVTSIGSSSFYSCSSLTSVYYSGTASQWASISFGNGSSNPLYCAGNLYLNGTLAEEITLEGITSINAYAFYNCPSLTSVTIGSSITSISTNAFKGCTSLTTVYYYGTVDEWNTISIDSSNTSLTSAAIYYYSTSEPDYTDGYNYWHYVDGVVTVWTEE